ncbi:MAG TPA: hypothetical protein VD833_21565 [Vicinamibacterales bacterium]|nr:hypothetical protein [Vicinamibacterales bacterium]
MTAIPNSTRRRRGAAAALVLLLVAGTQTDALINGVDDFEHTAVAAIMIYAPDPANPSQLGWRATCSGVLIHKRVVQTAGHCIQFTRAGVEAGLVRAVWVSFQQDPLSHFNSDPAVVDPAGGGWREIESMHNNPDNIDFLWLIQTDPQTRHSVWGTFHDSGAIILKDEVKGIRPMKMASTPGEVDRLLDKAGCEVMGPDCALLLVSYGLRGWPPGPDVLPQWRQSVLLRFKGIDPLFIEVFGDPPGAATGAVCPGDSGGAFVLLGKNGRDKTIVAINSSPADPFGIPCADGALQYRVDTESHVRFIKGVILQSLYGGLRDHPGVAFY